jgi:hypothetical protein
LLLAFLISTHAFAKCRIYIPVKSFNHEGYTVFFDFNDLLSKKNYTEVFNPDEADDVIMVDGVEIDGPRFHHAKSIIEMVDLKIEDSVTCLTQICSIRDFGKAFRKSYKKLSDQLPDCQ